jgi:hypothetical protein
MEKYGDVRISTVISGRSKSETPMLYFCSVLIFSCRETETGPFRVET